MKTDPLNEAFSSFVSTKILGCSKNEYLLKMVECKDVMKLNECHECLKEKLLKVSGETKQQIQEALKDYTNVKTLLKKRLYEIYNQKTELQIDRDFVDFTRQNGLYENCKTKKNFKSIWSKYRTMSAKPSQLEMGTDSLVQNYKKNTPGQ